MGKRHGVIRSIAFLLNRSSHCLFKCSWVSVVLSLALSHLSRNSSKYLAKGILLVTSFIYKKISILHLYLHEQTTTYHNLEYIVGEGGN